MDITIILFISAFLLPILEFLLGRLFRIPAKKLGFVMITFWILLFLTTIFAFLQNQNEMSQKIIKINIALAVILIAPRAIMFKLGKKKLLKKQKTVVLPNKETARITDKNNTIPVSCVSKLVAESGGVVPWSTSGETDNRLWIFYAGNYYKWDLSIDIAANDSGVMCTAVSKGLFGPWYSWWGPHNATAQATGSIICKVGSDKCLAEAMGGENERSDDDFSAAVLIKGSAQGASAALEVTAAVSVAGQVMIEKIKLGAEAGIKKGGISAGVEASVDINMPKTAQQKNKLVHVYSYECR